MDRAIINGIGSVFTVEGIGGPDDLLLQGSRCQEGFKHGARFKGICDGPIPPGLGPGLKKLVGIVRRINRQGQNLSGRGLHGNGKASFGPPLLNRPAQLRLNNVLNMLVEGKDDIPKLFSLLGRDLIHNLPAPGIFPRVQI